MNCDQVFVVLTRGPFPTGDESDSAVESHLAACGECLRLAEALRPALDLTHEAVSAEEARDLPGYWGELTPATARQRIAVSQWRGSAESRWSPTVLLNLRRRLSIRVEGKTAWRVNLWRLAAAIALGATLAAILRSMGVSDQSPRPEPQPAYRTDKA